MILIEHVSTVFPIISLQFFQRLSIARYLKHPPPFSLKEHQRNVVRQENTSTKTAINVSVHNKSQIYILNSIWQKVFKKRYKNGKDVTLCLSAPRKCAFIQLFTHGKMYTLLVSYLLPLTLQSPLKIFHISSIRDTQWSTPREVKPRTIHIIGYFAKNLWQWVLRCSYDIFLRSFVVKQNSTMLLFLTS